jgi:hypothetical protein
MLFDETDIEESHSELVRSGPAKLLLGHMSIAVDLVRKSYIHRTHLAGPQAIIFALGVRIVNSVGACTRLGANGYFAAAFHQLRDIAEIGQLIELFIAKPEKMVEWAEVVGWDRVRKFSFGKMDRTLRGNFNISTRWSERFEHYSELGTHVGAGGAYAIAKDNEFSYGPHVDPEKFLQILGEVSIDAIEVTRAYLKLVDAHHDESVMTMLPGEHDLFLLSAERAYQDYRWLFNDDPID